MRTPIRFTLHLAAAGLLATAMACGGGGGGSTETADITGTLNTVSTASVHSSAAPTTGFNIVAVDENGNSADSATGVTGDFTLTVPTGHDYVLIVSDSSGILSAVVYKDSSGATASEMAVVSGTASVDLGTITVDSTTRTVEVADPAAVTEVTKDGTSSGVPEPTDSKMKSDTNGDGIPDAVVDTDGDHIPDAVDTDKDNDGIENSKDKRVDGTDLSTDFNNDGTPDAESDDIDGDGIPNSEDKDMTTGKDMSRDANNDGIDDDREGSTSDSTSGSTSGSATAGETLFATNCASCHGTDAAGTTTAPDIRGEASDDITEAIGEVSAMSSLSTLMMNQVDDIAAYLQSLGNGSEGSEGSSDSETGSGSDSGSTDTGSTTDTGSGAGSTGSTTGGSTGSGSGSTGSGTGTTGGGTTTVTGDATAGGTYFASNCAACHGTDGSGGPVVSKSIRGSSTTVISGAFSSVSMMGSLTMPTNQQIADIAAFLTP